MLHTWSIPRLHRHRCPAIKRPLVGVHLLNLNLNHNYGRNTWNVYRRIHYSNPETLRVSVLFFKTKIPPCGPKNTRSLWASDITREHSCWRNWDKLLKSFAYNLSDGHLRFNVVAMMLGCDQNSSTGRDTNPQPLVRGACYCVWQE